MTKTSKDQCRQAGAIELTTEMIEAGVDEFLSFDSEGLVNTDPRLIVCNIFQVMTQAAQQSVPQDRVSTG